MNGVLTTDLKMTLVLTRGSRVPYLNYFVLEFAASTGRRTYT